MKRSETMTAQLPLGRGIAPPGRLPVGTSSQLWHRLTIMAILSLSTFLNFFRLGQEGYANLYYAAAVKSMLASWHNFFFVSFDPGGFVSVDKPPLGLWVQAISAKVFGFGGTSLLLPQALAGVLSVALLYHLVRGTLGPTAGLISALVLATTPISVSANRNNTMDSVLLLVLLLAAWAVLRATETGQLRWLLICVVLVGLGFNIKMLQAFLVLPAFYLLYLIAAPLPWTRRFLHLAVATIVLLAVSMAWAVVVDLTPPDQRPYVGSSQDNTVLELIIGHNGLKRLLPGGLRGILGSQTLPGPSPSQQLPRSRGGPSGQPAPSGSGSPPDQLVPGGPSAPGTRSARPFSSEIGEPGTLRLFNRQLAGQISWLLPLAGLGLVVATWQTRLRFPLHRRHQSLLLWGAWWLTQAVFFSVANMFHRYYLEMMAPAIAALVGAGVVAIWKEYRRPGPRGRLLPLAMIGSALAEAVILVPFPAWSRWLTPLVVGMCLVVAAVLVIARLTRQSRSTRWTRTLVAVGLLALLIPPTVWSLIPVLHGGDAGLPFAGPDLLAETRRDETRDVEPLIDYLLANQQNGTFLVATLNARDAAPIILATGEPVMALGGFTGADPILEAEELAQRVEDGDVRFFLLPRQVAQQRELGRWVMEHSTPVPPQLWMAAQPRGGRPGDRPPPAQQLFDSRPLLANPSTGGPESM
jgi:4-amino-4-deoxy-L-arabinose transferase-like glycosyltransferase